MYIHTYMCEVEAAFNQKFLHIFPNHVFSFCTFQSIIFFKKNVQVQGIGMTFTSS